jgi:hypothetical protein
MAVVLWNTIYNVSDKNISNNINIGNLTSMFSCINIESNIKYNNIKYNKKIYTINKSNSKKMKKFK